MKVDEHQLRHADQFCNVAFKKKENEDRTSAIHLKNYVQNFNRQSYTDENIYEEIEHKTSSVITLKLPFYGY